MGSHVWTERCPYCGFEEMVISTYSDYYEMNCQICGYSKRTEEKVPHDNDVELAKRALSNMGEHEKQKAIELYYEDDIPLITRLKKKTWPMA